MRLLLKRISLITILLSFISTLCFAIDLNADYELGLSKKLLIETAKVLENKNNMLILDEIYSYDWYYKMDTETSLPYLTNFNNSVDKFRSIEERKEFLQYFQEQAKQMQIAQLTPNMLSVATIAFTAGNPLRSLIAIAGTALSSYTNYTTEKQRSELNLMQDQFELNQNAKEEFNKLLGDMRNYITKSMAKYGFNNDDFASVQTVKEFVNFVEQYSDSPVNLINQLNIGKYRRELAIFPEYWAALGTAYYETEQYEAALDCISEFEKYYVKTMYHDNAFANLMMIKAYCIEEIYDDESEKNALLSEVIPLIVENGDNSWIQLYYAVKAYENLAASSGDNTYILKAYDLMNEVITLLSTSYNTDYEDYMNGVFIQKMKEGIDNNIKSNNEEIGSKQSALKQDGIGEQLKDDYENQIEALEKKNEELENNKKEVDELEYTFLPPDSSLLVSLAKEFMELAEITGKTTESAYINQISNLNSNIRDYYSRAILFGEPYPMTLNMDYDHRVPLLNPFSFFNGRDYATLYVPLEYLTVSDSELSKRNTRIVLCLNSFEYELTDWTYEIRKDIDSNKKTIVFNFSIDDPVETGLTIQKDTIPYISIRFESSMIRISNPFKIIVNKPKELLKGFKVNVLKGDDSKSLLEELIEESIEESIEELIEESIDESFESLVFLEEVLNDFDKAFPIEYDSRMIIDNIGDKEINVSLPYSVIEDSASKQAGDEYPLFAIEENSLLFYLDINSYPQLGEILPFLTDLNFEVYAAEYNQGMSEADYLEMIYFLLGDKGRNAVSNIVVTISTSVPGIIKTCNKCVQIDENTIEYKFPLIDFLLLKEPLSFSVSWY